LTATAEGSCGKTCKGKWRPSCGDDPVAERLFGAAGSVRITAGGQRARRGCRRIPPDPDGGPRRVQTAPDEAPAEYVQGLSGRDIESLAREAGLGAISRSSATRSTCRSGPRAPRRASLWPLRRRATSGVGGMIRRPRLFSPQAWESSRQHGTHNQRSIAWAGSSRSELPDPIGNRVALRALPRRALPRLSPPALVRHAL